MAVTQHTETSTKKVVLPYVAPLKQGDELTLDPMEWICRKERHLMLELFRDALSAAGVEFVEVDHA